MQKTEFPGESWNVKRIGIATVIFAILIFALFYGINIFTLDNKSLFERPKPNSFGKVQGAATAEPSPSASVSLPSAQDVARGVESKFNDIRNEITKLNVQDIASSSPQVQKIINDIKTLPDYPKNQAKDICQKICGGL